MFYFKTMSLAFMCDLLLYPISGVLLPYNETIFATFSIFITFY